MGGEGVGEALVQGVVDAGLAGVVQEDLHAGVEVGEEGWGGDSLARKTVLCQGWHSRDHLPGGTQSQLPGGLERTGFFSMFQLML